MKKVETLEAIADIQRCFDCALTSSELPRRDVIRQVKNGLVESAGSVAVCDEDGFSVDPERFREGFRLTDAGWDYLAAVNSEYARTRSCGDLPGTQES